MALYAFDVFPPWARTEHAALQARVLVVEPQPMWTMRVRAAIELCWAEQSALAASRIVRQISSLEDLRRLDSPQIARVIVLAVTSANLAARLNWLALRHNDPTHPAVPKLFVTVGPQHLCQAESALREAGAEACGFGIFAVDRIMPSVKSRLTSWRRMRQIASEVSLPWQELVDHPIDP